MNAIVKFTDVSKNFQKQKVLDRVSFQIGKASITTLIGPNGAGKSTVAKLMLGIEEPSSGHITRLTKKISYIPQKLIFNSSMPMDVKSLVKHLSGSKVSDNLSVTEFAQLDQLANKQISELSGGQLQKVLLAASMMNNPELIVLDEPTQGLDISAQQDFYHLLEALRHQFGVSIFMISHDLYAVMKNSDQVLCLNNHICCSGKPDKAFKANKDMPDIAPYTHNHDHDHL